MPPLSRGTYKIVPSRFQVPPVGVTTLASDCGSPPSMSSRFNLLFAKKPIDRLSGDQNGYSPPSVPCSARGAVTSSDRIHNCGPRGPSAVNATCVESGEIANDLEPVVPDVLICNRISGASVGS